MSQISGKLFSTPIQQADLDFLSNNGYIMVMQKEEYDRALAEVSNLTRMNDDWHKEAMEEKSSSAILGEEERKTHSILFHLEGREKKNTQLENVASEKTVVTKEENDMAETESKINELIQKKSTIDRMVQYNDKYMSLTGLGVITLNDLNVRNYRVSDNEFSDFVRESKETKDELRSIAEKGSFHASILRTEFPSTDYSQLWSVSIGLAKLQADQNLVNQRFLLALGILQNFDSTIENNMMAAEIMTASRADPSQTSTNSDLQKMSEYLASLDHELRHDHNVPKELSVGIAAVIMFGKRSDGTYPTDRFVEFSKMTSSYESAAILSLINVPSDQLAGKFQSFRSLFNSWGYEISEDTELAAAYLSISDLGPDDVKTKMTIIIDALKNYLEYPLVAAAILTSVQTLEANETLDLMEKAFSLLWSLTKGFERSELISLSVMMIPGIENSIVKELDSTANVTKAPSQLVNASSHIFFVPYMPLIIAHSAYYSTFSGIGGAHPAHVHGFGGFSG